MIIGTVRPEEARAYDSKKGYHRFHAEETQEEYGSFEIFWQDSAAPAEENDWEGIDAGWYFWSCFPGCLPDSEPVGPFAYSQQAHEEADPWSPDYDE